MLRYLGNNKYETYLEDGTKIEVSVNDLENIVRDVKEEGKDFNHESSDRLHEATKCKVAEEDYEMLVSENKHLAEWIKTRTGLSDEKIAAIANTGTFAVIDVGSKDKESDTTE